MYVTQVKVANVRGFHGERTVRLDLPARGGWTVLAGRNGAGKTTLLRAIALALAGPDYARTLMSDAGSWVTRDGEDGVAAVRIALDALDGWPADRPRPNRAVETGLGWVASAGRSATGERHQPDMYVNGDADFPLAAPHTRHPGWFCAAYGPFRRLAGGSAEGQQPPGPAGRMATLFDEDASLAESMSWLINLHLRRLEQRPGAAELLRVVLRLLSDGLMPDGYRVEDVDSEGLWVTRPGLDHAFPLREMSDGFRTVTALVLDLTRQLQAAYGHLATEGAADGRLVLTAPGVVLIDEVDAHLHVTWQRSIGGWLTEHFPNLQFIVSTHSPYICQSADPGGLVRLPGPMEERAPEVVADELYGRIVYGTGDDAAMSELFGLETPYSDRAQRRRRRLVDLERKVYAGSASEAETAEYGELAAQLSSSLEARVSEVAARLGGDR